MNLNLQNNTLAPFAGVMTLPEVARLLSVSKRTLERENARGRLKFVRIGRCVRVRADDLAAYTAGLAPSAS